MPPVAVHFNGSVNLPDTETVFRELTARVPLGVRRLPDGETGDRAAWIGYQLPRLLSTPGLERVEPDPTAAGAYGGNRPTVRLTPGTDPDRLDWPDLGYARAYLDSYATFARLRDEGVVAQGIRFQVQYPTALAVSGMFHPRDRQRLVPSYRRALLADLDRLIAAVPAADLAVQWDVAVEIGMIERAPDTFDLVVTALAGHLDHPPPDLPVGVHLCYGDAGHRHFLQPASLATQVQLANALAQRPGRPPSWVSFTVPQDRDDDGYFAPLAGLHTGAATEVYLALVPYHPDEQVADTATAQVRMIDRYLPAAAGPWGICTECGMGRAERADVPRLLDLHRAILDGYADERTARLRHDLDVANDRQHENRYLLPWLDE